MRFHKFQLQPFQSLILQHSTTNYFTKLTSSKFLLPAAEVGWAAISSIPTMMEKSAHAGAE
jgi:hypothetical protein